MILVTQEPHGPGRSRREVVRFLVVAALVLLGARGVSAAADEPLLSLDEALRLAFQGNRQLQIARLDVDRQESLADSYRAKMLPAVDFTARRTQLLSDLSFPVRQGALGTFPLIGPVPAEDRNIALVEDGNTQVGVGVSQAITGLHKLALAAEVYDHEAEAARQGVRVRAHEVARTVREAYFGLVDLQEALSAARSGQAFQEEFERTVRDYLARGTALPVEMLEAQAGVARARQSVASLENSLASQREQLNLLLGRAPSTPFRVEPPGEEPPPAAGDLETLLPEALAARPEIRQAAARLAEAEAGREAQRADFVPEVGVRLSYERESNTGILPPELVTLAIEGRYDVFDGGGRDALVAEKQASVEQARAALEEARSQVEVELRGHLRRTSELELKVETQRLVGQSTEEKFRVARFRHQHGMGLGRDVLSAQAELAQAQRDYTRAVLDLALARAELERILGRDP